MENLSHSRPPNKSSTSTSFSKKSCNGTTFMTRTTYDDVFGGPPKFAAPTLAPRPEDYTEIFGGFHAPRASSIPVLDLPLVDNDDVFFDVQSSGFDYDEVFGGFNALDSAVSFHDLMMDQSKGFSGGDVDSSDEAWYILFISFILFYYILFKNSLFFFLWFTEMKTFFLKKKLFL